MANITEIRRINSFLTGEAPPPVRVSLHGKCSEAERAMALIRSVMTTVASHRSDDWPTDLEWESLLPNWFVSYTKQHTDEAIAADHRLCHWEAWLDALKDRDWEWWSCAVLSDGFDIHVTTSSWPYQVGPLFYLMYAVGAVQVSVSDESDFEPNDAG